MHVLQSPMSPQHHQTTLANEKKQSVSADPEPIPARRVIFGEDKIVAACFENNLEFLSASEQLCKRIDSVYRNFRNEKNAVIDDKWGTLLHMACYGNRLEVVKLLLERGANPNIKLPESGFSPVEVACADKKLNPEIVSILADCLFPNWLDVNAIHCVAAKNYPSDFTLLQLACRLGNVHAIRTLLEHHADPDLVSPGWKMNPLHLICANNNIDGDAVTSLLRAGASVNARCGGSITALHIRCSLAGQFVQQPLDALLSWGADVNAVTSNGVTPLMLAAKSNPELALHLLRDDRVDVNVADCRGWQAIHYAAQTNHETVINTLAGKGADANAKANNGATPLHLAVMGKHEPSIFALLDHGADIFTKAPVTAYSPAKICEITAMLCCLVLVCPLAIPAVQAMCIVNDCDEFWRDKPIHERHVRRYAQSCCPTFCGLSPMQMADEGLRERMADQIVITSEPGTPTMSQWENEDLFVPSKLTGAASDETTTL